MLERNDMRTDRFGAAEELRAALAQPDLSGAQAAYRLAVALGRCRLFGVEPGADLDGTLPAELALPAAATLAGQLEVLTEEARQLGPRWDCAVDPIEADGLCVDLLDARMEAWAALSAIDEANRACRDAGEPGEVPLAQALDHVHDRLEAFDSVLAEQVDILATVADTRLLDNWRGLLGAEHRRRLPWWLDGRLEQAARAAMARAAATQPDPTAWRLLAERVRRERAGHPVRALPTLVDAPGAEAIPGNVLRWSSPDRRWLAELRLPGQSTAEQEVEVQLLLFVTSQPEAQPGELQDLPAWLGGVHSIIDQGQARFTLARLRQAQSLDLRVGDPAEDWTPLVGEVA
jgi:hypothetical protein